MEAVKTIIIGADNVLTSAIEEGVKAIICLLTDKVAIQSLSCLRTSTERSEALEAGDFILIDITTNELINAADMTIEMKQKGVFGKPDYVDETVSMKVVRIIQGYLNVVNKMV